MSKVTSKNIGTFSIPRKEVIENTQVIADMFSFLKMVPVRVEPQFYNDIMDYTAICSHFEEIVDGCAVPNYNLIVKTKNGIFLSVEIEKL